MDIGFSSILHLYSLVFIFSCGNKSKLPISSQIDSNPVLKSVNEKIYYNAFINIVLKTCSEHGEFQYTEENTSFFYLNLQNEADCFVFSSKLICGHPMGSCGRNITVFKKSGMAYSEMERNAPFIIVNYFIIKSVC